MKTLNIETSWHKATDSIAITYKQLEYINSLRNEENCPEWPFGSTTNVIRSLTKLDASDIIEAFKNGKKVTFN